MTTETLAPETVHTWRKVFVEGIAPQLSNAALLAMRGALASDDPRLLQGATTSPPPMLCVQDWPVEAACIIGFGAWQGEGKQTVKEVEEHFARTLHECDVALNCPAACRWFTNWYDDTPRDQMRRQMLEVIDGLLAQREVAVAA